MELNAERAWLRTKISKLEKRIADLEMPDTLPARGEMASKLLALQNLSEASNRRTSAISVKMKADSDVYGR